MRQSQSTSIVKTKRRLGFIIPLGLTLAMIFTGSDLILLAFRPLDYLGMPYPHILRYTHFIVPVGRLCALDNS